MTERSIQHSTLVFERHYDSSPPDVFRAWSDEEALLRWGSPGDDWTSKYERFDFRPGGGELLKFGPKGGELHTSRSTYLDIVENNRIVSLTEMISGGVTTFAAIMTVELKASGSGTALKVTEQATFFDGGDTPEAHEGGWSFMLDQLGTELRRKR